MKRLLVFILCVLLSLSGCGQKEDASGTIPPVVPDAIPTEHIEVETPLAAVSVPATTDVFCLDDGTELFSYTYQYLNLIFPDASVADKITLEFLNRVDATTAESESILQTAKTNYSANEEWIPYFYRVLYSPTRIDHGVLSLHGIQNSFTGGTHGNLSCVSVNYDMTTGDVLTFGSIMHPDADKEDFIALISQQLKEVQDEYYIYDDFEAAVRDRLGGDENLYEDFYFSTTGLCFYFAPYEIAPYASGIITVEIPYSQLTGLIYDGYFPEERQLIEGSVKTGSFMDTDMTAFNNMAEVMLTEDAPLQVLYTNGTIEDLRITLGGDGKTMPDYTIFAALTLSQKDAVVFGMTEAQLNNLTVSYSNGEEIVTHSFF